MPSALIVTFAQSTVLNAISNLLAQLIDQRKNTTPFTLNTLALLQFVTYGILIVPINFYWQRALEARYPGFPSRAEISNLLCSWRSLLSFSALRAFFSSAISSEASPRLHDDATALPLHREKEKQKETGFLFDLTVAGAMNIVLFVVLINFLKGESLAKVWELVLVDFRPIMIARLKYRPVVSTLMYTVIPMDRRVVFGSACGVIWGIYLSLYAVV
ncbi:uncharacterized protein N7496_007712 [Penicillium cataractarum]|uniref:Uncharacterized protein n=1 Tax=Penicillium cataractarum TaxID=2100454 RepID=A0A9W9RX80_9EURO|nr:uncharacterized protein N7496_007712 [Penicillium cataractarum]KAJ5367952.1 hypothetical protein N7496_007712 [Penicillium cataractarum]